MGNVSIKHQRKPIFERAALTSRRSSNVQQVIKSSRSSSICPSNSLHKKQNNSLSSIMPQRYVHKSAIKPNNNKYEKDSLKQSMFTPQRNLRNSFHQNNKPIISPQKQCYQQINTSRNYQEDESRKQIMKKIRNFNEFINMVKKQIHSKNPDNESVKVKMQLQNQNFDVSKYQKILQKQFSRQGSKANVKFQDDNEYKIVNISFQQPKQQSLTRLTTDSQISFKHVSSKQQIKSRIKQASQRLRQLTKKFYQQNQPQQLIVNQNISNIENIVDNKVKVQNVSKHMNNIDSYIKKMTDISKYQFENNQKMLEELKKIDQESKTCLLSYRKF